jgi:hypothetical protein
MVRRADSRGAVGMFVRRMGGKDGLGPQFPRRDVPVTFAGPARDQSAWVVPGPRTCPFQRGTTGSCFRVRAVQCVHGRLALREGAELLQ